ncbi:glycosyltransferase [Specibacter sp. NPDC057265]|uniref:glycosyltransferase n=1 Tax=Specibacter sp. NPDC057265 TaxID=3346075 RepID=UPI00363B1B10
MTESLGGGVQNAISKYTHMANTSEHIVLGRLRKGEATGEYSIGTHVIEYKGGFIGFLAKIRDASIELKPDIVHLHSSYAGLARVFISLNIPIVYSPHCFAFERTDKSGIWRKTARWVEKILAIRSQVIVAVSPHEALLAKDLVRNGSVFYVPNVLLNSVNDVPKLARPTVVMVGRIGAQKDPKLFAAVSKKLRHLYNFIWVGDGDSDLRQELVDSGVRVTGWQTPLETRRLVASCHLCFHTGAWEAAPISTIEAASSGTAVLARGIPTMASLGYHVTSGSFDHIANVINAFFTDEAFKDLVEAQTLKVAKGLSVQEAELQLQRAYEYSLSRKKTDEI